MEEKKQQKINKDKIIIDMIIEFGTKVIEVGYNGHAAGLSLDKVMQNYMEIVEKSRDNIFNNVVKCP